jgi:hypothetical protein
MGTESNHCRIVAESLAGNRKIDEKTYASLAVLDERLERLRNISETFAGVEFSPDAARLLSRKNTIAVG